MKYLLMFTCDDENSDYGWFDTEEELSDFVEYHKNIYPHSFQVFDALYVSISETLNQYIDEE